MKIIFSLLFLFASAHYVLSFYQEITQFSVHILRYGSKNTSLFKEIAVTVKCVKEKCLLKEEEDGEGPLFTENYLYGPSLLPVHGHQEYFLFLL